MKKYDIEKMLPETLTIAAKFARELGDVNFRILSLLMENEYTITELSKELDVSYRTTQRYVYELQNKKLIEVSKYTDGKKYLIINVNEFHKLFDKIIKKEMK